MKYYLVTLLINDKGQDGSTLVKYDVLDNAIVAYHNKLAAFHNASDVRYAVVEILDEYGRIVKSYTETVIHEENTEAIEG